MTSARRRLKQNMLDLFPDDTEWAEEVERIANLPLLAGNIDPEYIEKVFREQRLNTFDESHK